MKWFRERHTRQSEKNERIDIARTFGVWEVVVNNTGQTTPYTHSMWEDAFIRLKKRGNAARSVLMLGLGAGGQIKQLHQAFPGCTVTVVEYDPEMIRIAGELALHKPFPFPTILQGDARDVVQKLTAQYDLILVDLFHGEEPSPLTHSEPFLQHVRERLSPSGTLIINVYQKKEYLGAAQQIFPNKELWTFRQNHLGAFWYERREAH